MAVYGDFQGTGGGLAVPSDALIRDVSRKLMQLEPEIQPLARFLHHPKLKKITAKSFKYEWAETDNLAQFTQVNNSGGYLSTDTSLVVDDSTIISISSILVVQRTNETMRVTANNTGSNTVTVSRSYGGTAAAALLDNDYVTVLPTAPSEGDESQVGIVVNETFKHNFIQEVRHPFNATWVGQASDNYFGPLLPRRRAEKLRDHKMNIEMGLFYNERATVTTGDERESAFGGLKEFITTNSKSFGGNPTFDEMVIAAEDHFEFGSATKFLFVGKSGFSGVAKVTTDTIRSGSIVTSMGLNVSRLELQHGTLMLHKHILFRGNEFTKRGFVLDMDNLAFVTLQKNGSKGGDTMLRQNLQAPSATADKEEWYAAITLKRGLEKTHAIWNDLN